MCTKCNIIVQFSAQYIQGTIINVLWNVVRAMCWHRYISILGGMVWNKLYLFQPLVEVLYPFQWFYHYIAGGWAHNLSYSGVALLRGYCAVSSKLIEVSCHEFYVSIIYCQLAAGSYCQMYSKLLWLIYVTLADGWGAREGSWLSTKRLRPGEADS